jgi:hypothetical protein
LTPEIDDFRPATPNDHFPGPTLENAPDLSLMAKARAGFHGPYGTGINQLFKGMGGAEYIASLLTGYTGEEKEEAGTIPLREQGLPGRLDLHGAAALGRRRGLRRRHRPRHRAACPRTSPPS